MKQFNTIGRYPQTRPAKYLFVDGSWLSDESFLTLHIRRLSRDVYQIVEQDVGIEIIWDLKARDSRTTMC